MSDKKIIRYEVEIDDDQNIIINLHDYIKNLSDEDKKMLIEDNGYWSFISEEFAKDIVNKFSRDNYESIYQKLRSAILTSEAMPKMIIKWAEGMIHEREDSKVAEKYWSQAYWELYDWIRRPERNASVPRLPDKVYGKPYPEWMIEKAKAQAVEFGLMFPNPEEDK